MLRHLLFFLRCNTLPLVFVCFFSLDVCAEDWQSPAFMVQAFTEVALKNEFDTDAQAVRKWREPLRVWIKDQAHEATLDTDASTRQRLVQMHIKHLASITEHSYDLVKNASDANVSLIFTTEKNWARDLKILAGNAGLQHANSAVCMAGINLDKVGAINHAWVLIPVDQAQRNRKLVTCIVEELTQIMGLPNDSVKVYPSVFNDKTPQDLLTGLDSLLLKMLYHPMVKVGMRELQVTPILHAIISQWQLDGTIDHANSTVKQGELYPLMGY